MCGHYTVHRQGFTSTTSSAHVPSSMLSHILYEDIAISNCIVSSVSMSSIAETLILSRKIRDLKIPLPLFGHY